jgi:hypothetical protein
MGLLQSFTDDLYIVTKERGTVRFGDVKNYAQRDMITTCENQLLTTGRIRIVVLKARQIGISTAIEAVIFSLSIILDNFKSLIVSHEQDSAEHIKSMTDTYWNTYHSKEFHETKYQGRKHLSWADIGSGIQIATAKNIGAGRSRTIHGLHASEVAFWLDPSTLMTGLRQSIPNSGISAIFIESTANGIGNYFHQIWTDAVAGVSEYIPLFYPWHQHPEYTADHLPDEMIAKYFPQELDAEEQTLASMGVSLSRLTWRRYALANLVNKDSRRTVMLPLDAFHQEYPSNPVEAFVSTGRNVFSMPDLLTHYQPMTGTRGRLVRVGNTVEFVQDSQGPLTIFRYPSNDTTWGLYRIGADPTHTTTGDYACGQVINRRTMEQVAVYRRKCDPVTFGEDMFLLGLYYNTASIAPEKEGPGYATVGYLLGQHYPDVWESQKVDQTPGKVVANTYGWGTNVQTKHLAISNLLKAVVDKPQKVGQITYGLIVHDQMTIAEMRDYVTDPKGSGYCNADGSPYDDGVMALAIAITTHYIDGPIAAPQTSHGYTEFNSNVARVEQKLQDAGISLDSVVRQMTGEDESPAWMNWSDE